MIARTVNKIVITKISPPFEAWISTGGCVAMSPLPTSPCKIAEQRCGSTKENDETGDRSGRA